MRNLKENHRKPLPIVLVAGFLGAGKTTLMRRLILNAARRELRPAVIVNEFGAADVDSHILRQSDAELIAAISGGCACCSGQDDLRETLIELATRDVSMRPGVVLLEASGLADPLLLMDAVTSAELLPLVRVASLVAVADAARPIFDDELGPLLRRQVQLADVIVLNKTDLAGESVTQVEAALRVLNPRAALWRAVQADCDLMPIWATLEEDLPRATTENTLCQSAPHAHYHTVVCPSPHPLDKTRLEAALGNLGPQVWRAKGFVRVCGLTGWQLLQYTGGPGGRWHLAPFHLPAYAEEPDGFLVFIGAALDRDQLLRDFSGTKLLAIM